MRWERVSIPVPLSSRLGCFAFERLKCRGQKIGNEEANALVWRLFGFPLLLFLLSALIEFWGVYMGDRNQVRSLCHFSLPVASRTLPSNLLGIGFLPLLFDLFSDFFFFFKDFHTTDMYVLYLCHQTEDIERYCEAGIGIPQKFANKNLLHGKKLPMYKKFRATKIVQYLHSTHINLRCPCFCY